MARQKRLNIPGAIYHVITRGLNGMTIFKDDKDRKAFLDRLTEVFKRTNCICYGWALMSNHVHLVIRPTKTSLSEPMRKLFAGYAIGFNRRYKRRGYLYQNRYKSILCQEDKYFLELIRYIHLNPIRAGMIKEIEKLNESTWTGHSTICGRQTNEFQEISEVLKWFGKERSGALKGYIQFIKDGWNEGKRVDLTGGGLRRSAGGWEGIQALKKTDSPWRGDDQILGEGDFVTDILKEAEEQLRRKDKMKLQKWTIDRLVHEVCEMMSIEEEKLKRRGRLNVVSYAKSIIAYWGYKELDISCADIGRYLDITKQSVHALVQQGEVYVKQKNLKLTN